MSPETAVEEMTQPHRDWVLWDGDCGFCRRGINWCRLRDHTQAFQFVPYQAAPTPPMTKDLYASCAHSVHVVTATGAILSEGAAALYILAVCGYPRLAQWGRQAPLFPFVQIAYRLVARHRSFFSRFIFRPDP